ncbi:MAG: AraC family transcriptional regulator [Lachnospiraceae bacterium]|nr:AraC family transcriptional regulator [Lachnospiraceae bacterium]MDE7334004.1 AraC family transcriptional regulator [Lachnospiraceae bacterium]
MGNTRHRIEESRTSSFGESKLLYISTSKYEGDWQSILHSHPFSELFYVVNGSGFFVAEGEGFPVGKNDMVIINPHVQHTEKSGNDSPLEYIVLGINGLSFSFENIASAQDGMSMQTAFGTVYKYNMQNSNVYAYLNIMLEEITHKKDNYETVCQNLLEVLLICMLRNDDLSIVKSTNTLLNRECTQIKNFLDSNYSENITLDTLASITHMNKYYMAHAFTRYTGLSPINYLIQKRIQEGKSLLESTSYSIAQISAMLGFSSQSYFSQAFKKATGRTPVQYRNEFRKQKERGDVENDYIQNE